MQKYIDRFGKFHTKPQDTLSQWRVSVYANVISQKGDFLMIKMADDNKWGFPGGGVEIDESIPEAIRRECFEETGYKVKLPFTLPGFVAESNFFAEKEKKYYHSIILIYSAILTDQKQYKRESVELAYNEISEVGWINPKALSKNNCQHIFLDYIKTVRSTNETREL